MEIAPRRIFKLNSIDQLCRIWNLADLHIGNISVDEALIMRVVEAIRKDPNSLCVCPGDLAECITKDDPRFDAGQLADCVPKEKINTLLKAEEDRVVELLRPIAHKILGITRGNHESKALKVHSYDLIGNVAGRLRVPDLKLTGFIPLTFLSTQRGNHTRICRIVALHGRCHATTDGGRMTYLNRQAQQFECDILMMGHVHKGLDTTVPRMGVNDKYTDIKAYTTTALFTGAFMKAYELHKENYAEEATYPPVTLGPRAVDIRMTRKGGVLRVGKGRTPETYSFETKVVDPWY